MTPERVQGEALMQLPHRMVMFVGRRGSAEGGGGARTPSTMSTRGGRATSMSGRRRQRRRCGGWRDGCGGVSPPGTLASSRGWTTSLLNALSTASSPASDASPTAGPRPTRVGPITRERLKWVSFRHSCIYRLCWCARSWRQATAADVRARPRAWDVVDRNVADLHRGARLRIVSLRLAVAVAVLGGIGPFFGSYEFVREERGQKARA